MRKLIRRLASIKLAVVFIIAIAVLTAIGTFIEADYDAIAAQKWVYQSIWMQIVMGIFAINLMAVIIDRYPWKKRHWAFICAHIGILFILLGQYLSNNYGLDGSLRVGVGESNKFVVIPSKTDLSVYSSFDGSSYTKLFEKEVDFFLNPPRPDRPLSIPIDGGDIQITNYQRYVFPQKKVTISTQKKAGAGLRFQIHNDRVNVVEWVVQRGAGRTASHDFGPAQLHLGEAPSAGRGLNEIYLTPMIEKGVNKVKYTLFRKDSARPALTGSLAESETLQTGWMGLQLKVLQFLPQAEESWSLTPKERPTPLTTSAALVNFRGKEQWILLNDTIKLFTDKAVYILTYAHRRQDLGFPVMLERFVMDKYQGTQRAASYKSHVQVPGVGSAEISMNEPLKHNGLTIYQASFEEGPSGAEPTASIFSVNYDPGRWFKYLGSLIMTIGIILLFYFRKLYSSKPPKTESL